MNSNGCEAERQGQTTGEIEQLDKVLSVLSESVENLTDRLGKVLTIQTPIEFDTKTDADKEFVPMARSIRELRHNASRINNNIRDILNRLEL